MFLQFVSNKRALTTSKKAQRPPAIGVEPDIFTAPAPLIVVFLPFAILLDLKKQLSASLLRFLSHYLPAIPSLCE